jgi:hypothetical protein
MWHRLLGDSIPHLTYFTTTIRLCIVKRRCNNNFITLYEQFLASYGRCCRCICTFFCYPNLLFDFSLKYMFFITLFLIIHSCRLNLIRGSTDDIAYSRISMISNVGISPVQYFGKIIIPEKAVFPN